MLIYKITERGFNRRFNVSAHRIIKAHFAEQNFKRKINIKATGELPTNCNVHFLNVCAGEVITTWLQFFRFC